MPDKQIRCAWCGTELAAIDAAPIKYARLAGAPDEENMQCADYRACQERQDVLDDAQRRELAALGLEPLFMAARPTERENGQ